MDEPLSRTRSSESGEESGEKEWAELARQAWAVRDHARIVEGVRVGAAVLSESGQIFVGCNVEHKFRCHDVHAEVNAITSMIAAGERRLTSVLVVAEGEAFTPCGGCMDWIIELGGLNAAVACESARGGPTSRFLAADLMPHYPAFGTDDPKQTA